MVLEYKTFDVFYRNIEEKIKTKKFYVSLEDLTNCGIEVFYNDVQRMLEIKDEINLCYLKIGVETIIFDRCNFTGQVKGTTLRTKRETINRKEFYNSFMRA